MTDQTLTSDEIEAMKVSAQNALDGAYSEVFDQADNVLRLIAELERVKQNAYAYDVDADVQHAREIEDLKVKFAERAFDWEIQQERKLAAKDAEIERLKRASVPSLGQDLP